MLLIYITLHLINWSWQRRLAWLTESRTLKTVRNHFIYWYWAALTTDRLGTVNCMSLELLLHRSISTATSTRDTAVTASFLLWQTKQVHDVRNISRIKLRIHIWYTINDQYLLFHTQSPHVFCRLSLWSSKSSFSVIVQSQIWTGFDQVSVRITAVISPDQHFLNHQLYLILHQSWFISNLILRIFTFTEWSSSHLLRSLHRSIIICVDHLHLILLRHINADIEWYESLYC